MGLQVLECSECHFTDFGLICFLCVCMSCKRCCNTRNNAWNWKELRTLSSYSSFVTPRHYIDPYLILEHIAKQMALFYCVSLVVSMIAVMQSMRFPFLDIYDCWILSNLIYKVLMQKICGNKSRFDHWVTDQPWHKSSVANRPRFWGMSRFSENPRPT